MYASIFLDRMMHVILPIPTFNIDYLEYLIMTTPSSPFLLRDPPPDGLVAWPN
jgi:hypothetical protein